MLGEGLLRTLGCQVDDFEGTHEQVTSIPCGDNSCPICVVRIDPPEEIILDRDVVGSDLIDTITPALRDGELTFQDKVAQRNIAATLTECTGIEQPRYFDARAMHPPDPAVRFSRIDLSKFPVDEIEEADPRQKQIWIFEDVYQGFAVVSDGTQRYVYSGNPKILAEAERNGLLKDRSEDRSCGFAESLRRFIGGISKSDYFSVALAPELSQRSSSETDRQIAYARSILEHPETVYLKSARTAGGTLVVRCSKEGDQPVLESDSVEVGKLLGTYLSKLEHYKSAAVAAVAAAYKKSALKFSSVQGFLVEVLRDMTTPILEENIPVTRYRTKAGSEKAEFRMIFQLRELQGDLELVAHYAKSSLNDIAANISLGGGARATQQVVRGIYQQMLKSQLDKKELTQADINRRAKKSFEDLKKSALEFGRKFAERLATSSGQRELSDFAIDICPVWDPKKQELRFFFLEAQYIYGFTGLQKVHPNLADEVAQFKEQAEKKRNQENAARLLIAQLSNSLEKL
jgi:hypothetical protein